LKQHVSQRLRRLAAPVCPRAMGVAGLCLLITLLGGGGSAAASIHQVAIVISRPLEPYQQAADGIVEALSELRDEVAIDRYMVRGGSDEPDALAEKIHRRGTELLFAVGTDAYRELSERLPNLPMMISMVYDPLQEFNLADAPDVYGAHLRVPFTDQFAVYRQFLPAIDRISLIYMEEQEDALTPELREGARRAGLEVVPIPLGSTSELEPALARARSEGQAFLMVLDKAIYTAAATSKILLFFARSQTPVYSFSPNVVKAGALISVSASFRSNGVTAGKLGVRVLTRVPIEQRFIPTEELCIAWNETAARALRIELPDEMRQRCDLIYGTESGR